MWPRQLDVIGTREFGGGSLNVVWARVVWQLGVVRSTREAVAVGCGWRPRIW